MKKAILIHSNVLKRSVPDIRPVQSIHLTMDANKGFRSFVGKYQNVWININNYLYDIIMDVEFWQILMMMMLCTWVTWPTLHMQALRESADWQSHQLLDIRRRGQRTAAEKQWWASCRRLSLAACLSEILAPGFKNPINTQRRLTETLSLFLLPYLPLIPHINLNLWQQTKSINSSGIFVYI